MLHAQDPQPDQSIRSVDKSHQLMICLLQPRNKKFIFTISLLLLLVVMPITLKQFSNSNIHL